MPEIPVPATATADSTASLKAALKEARFRTKRLRELLKVESLDDAVTKLEEVLRLSHKIAVLRDRRLVEELENTADVDADRIMQTIASGASS